MTELEVTLWATCVGAAVGSLFSVLAMILNSRLTQGRERRQQVWQTEINRIVDLEERAGQLAELVGSYRTPEEVRQDAALAMRRLESDAGRFRRHTPIMQAIRDLHNGLSCLIADKQRRADCRQSSAEVSALYDNLLVECDKVTGTRKI